MSKNVHHRSLKHFRETSHLFWHYMGLGIMLTLCFLVGISATVYRMGESTAELMDMLDPELVAEYANNQRLLMRMYLIQVVFFILALLALCALNNHRIAGPYLALKRTFRAIREGKTSRRLQFRDYDRLDDVAAEFNQMMDTLSPSPPRSESASDYPTSP